MDPAKGAQERVTKTASGRTPLPNARPASVGLARRMSLASRHTTETPSLSPVTPSPPPPPPYTASFGQATRSPLPGSQSPLPNGSSTMGLAKMERENSTSYTNEAPARAGGDQRSATRKAGTKTKPTARATARARTSSKQARPCICQQCRKDFSRAEHLRRHIDTVHKKVVGAQCTACGKKFSRHDNGLAHARSCSGATLVLPVAAPTTVSAEGSQGEKYPGTKFTPINRVPVPTPST
ncbi:Hydrogen peroxide stress regulator 1 [Cytospora mali]|uniref:Hydrogen peroxide stress regulator 1 n=1 Tax=Cytospora mali TaxID=578113 RepID=A0A194W619_CYTMA|nr:Hydrogen peroxide stress regulator 1 [Valsa mali]